MFDKLLDFIIRFIDLFIPWFIVMPYERGLILRLGHFKQVVGNGLHFKIPFSVDTVLKTSIVRDTKLFWPQYITTKCGTSVTFAPCISWSIANVKTFLLEVENDTIINDLTLGICAEHLASLTWAEIQAGGAWKQNLINKLKRRASQFGVKIYTIQFAILTKTINIGLIGEKHG